MKITKNQMKDFLKSKLSTNEKWAIQALMTIYRNQTPKEKALRETIDHNEIGFTGTDAEFLTSLAKQYETTNSLSDKQTSIVKKTIPKYWNQVLHAAEQKDGCDKLKKIFEQEHPQVVLKI